MQERTKAKQKIHKHTEDHTHLLHPNTLEEKREKRLNWLQMAFI